MLTPTFLQNQLKWKIGIVVIVILFIVCWIMSSIAISVLETIYIAKLSSDVNANFVQSKYIIQDTIENLENEVRFLAKSKIVNNLVKAWENDNIEDVGQVITNPYLHPELVPVERSQKFINTWFSDYLKTKKHFLHVRYLKINDQHQCVDFINAENPSMQQTHILPSTIPSADIIIANMMSKTGDIPVYLSNIQFQQNKFNPAKPIPVITAIAPIYFTDPNQVFGVIAIDMDLREMTKQLIISEENTKHQGHYHVVDQHNKNFNNQQSTLPLGNDYLTKTMEIGYGSQQYAIKLIWTMSKQLLNQQFRLDKHAQIIIQWAFGLSIGMGLLIILLIHRLLHPLSNIIEATRCFYKRQYHNTLLDPSILKRKDEIGELANAFIMAVEKIESDEQQLNEYNRNLEHLVEERTQELRQQQDDLRKKNNELAIARDRAQDANKAKDVFFAKMGHEIRNPLQVITLAAETLEMRTEELEDEEWDEDVQDVLVSAWTLNEQVDSMMAYSKNKAGKMQADFIKFNLRELIEGELHSPIKRLAAYRDNQFQIEIHPEIDTMYTDRRWVQHALINLLNNACKFTKEGLIKLTVSPMSNHGKAFINFAVSDTGIGISDKQCALLFQPFQQADNSTHSEYGGTGLGLANVKNYSELMGGSISVKSVEGEGTTFTMSVPVIATPPSSQIIPSQSETETLVEINPPDDATIVLIIDDNPAFRETMFRVISAEGFYPITASNGDQGLLLAKQYNPAIITLDVLMPTMDGWLVLTKLKEDPQLAEIPVIMVTQIEGQNMACDLGAVDYLTKPVNRQRLVQSLNKYADINASESILLVDDEDKIRHLMKDILEKEGWHVDEADNGKTALEKIQQQVPGLILSDLFMPEMNGFEFIEELRKNPAWQSIPVIIITGVDLSEEERQRLTGYVTKIVQKGHLNQANLTEVITSLAIECGGHPLDDKL